MTSARAIVEHLGGAYRGRRAMMVRCPAHDDRTPSLSVTETRDGRPLVFCHTGCSQGAVIEALRAKGLWGGEAKGDPSYPGYLTLPHDAHHSRDDRERQQYARDLWDKAQPGKGTLVESYLRGRGIRMPVPDTLRYLPRLKHAPSNREWPCMIAALHDERGAVVAVQRTWLDPQGGKAPVQPAKMTCGPMGAAAVRLGPAGPTLGLAEGIETALSAKQLYRLPVWATLSANRLGKITLPAGVTKLMMFADQGEVGMREAIAAAEHYERPGLEVEVLPPSVNFGDRAKDFNDAVRVHA